MSEEKLFNDWAAKYEQDVFNLKDQYPFAGYLSIASKISTFIKGVENCHLLDLGIGTGLMLSLLKKESSFQFQGCDFSEQMIAFAEKRFDSEEIFKWNIAENNLPPNIENQTFDFILSAFTLHHFDHLQKIEIISRYFKTLNLSGKFIIADISFDTQEDFERTKLNEGKRWDDSEETGYFIKNDFLHLLDEHGFECSYLKMSYCAGLYLIG